MAELGDIILIDYAGRLDDGREFESTWRAGKPLEVEIGSGRLLPLIENALCEMVPGEKRTLELEPSQAYGEYDESLVISVPLANLPNAEELPVGRHIEIRTPQGTTRAKVLSISDDNVDLDLNHELAGKRIIFDLDLLAVKRPPAVERELHPEGCACGCHQLKEQIG